ncbi:YceD family protein [Caldibacillus debilis]|uniref:YceD family protein n=1 Tax=Caldibacillus debilis TaxID=301148 RepID=UPI00035CFBC0
MKALKWLISRLRTYRNQTFEFEETVDLSQLKDADPEIRDISPIHVKGSAEIGPKKITFHLHITGELILPCALTLADVRFPLDIHSTEIFLEKEDMEKEAMADEEIHVVEGNAIDLTPVVQELVLLEIPMQVYSENAEQNMLRSGKDWEFIGEGEEKKKIDPRLLKLTQLLEKKD